MPYWVVVIAIAVAALAAQYGTATKSATLFVGTVDVMELQMKADKNLPFLVTGDLV
jgi:hypothetical protein